MGIAIICVGESALITNSGMRVETAEKCSEAQHPQMERVHPQPGWTVENWRRAVASGELSQGLYLAWWEACSDMDGTSVDPAWIHRADADSIAAQFENLMRRQGAEELPLCGVPVAVKDNIDVEGWPTTAACPQFSYLAENDATVVRILREAGAIIVGKTNLDQFATGLVGTRSPYGKVPNTFDSSYISGGSSSGSASLVARGLVPIALGTDTAGSGRVPAAFNQIVGWKPTKGTFSTLGVVPACRTLDCVSIFALTVGDASAVASLLSVYDAKDPYSRECSQARRNSPLQSLSQVRIGVPSALEFFGDELAKAAYEQTLALCAREGAQLVQLNFTPFSQLARLLYESAWVAERSLVAKAVLEGPPEWMDPTVRKILEVGPSLSAEQAFSAEHRRADLARQINLSLAEVDALIVPTTPTIYRTSEVDADPWGTNSRLGTYTNFTNLADLCGLAVPGTFRSDGLPSGITLLAPAFGEPRVAQLGTFIQAAMGGPLGATGRLFSELDESDHLRNDSNHDSASEPLVQLAVVGAHLSGMVLNHQLTSRGGRLVAATETAPLYRLFALPGTQPEKPGLVRAEEGRNIAVEVWSLSEEAFAKFVVEVPAPLGIGNLELNDGTWVKGFICEPCALSGARDITEFGGFRAYLASK